MTTVTLTFSTGHACRFDGGMETPKGVSLCFTDTSRPDGSTFWVAAAEASPDTILDALRATRARYAVEAPDFAAQLFGLP